MDPKLEYSHDPIEIARRVEDKKYHNYLRDFVYGAIDGTVTKFAVVSGVASAQLVPLGTGDTLDRRNCRRAGLYCWSIAQGPCSRIIHGTKFSYQG